MNARPSRALEEEILRIQKARISWATAEMVFNSMLANIDRLWKQRDQLKNELPVHDDRGSTTGSGGAKRSFRQAMIAELSARPTVAFPLYDATCANPLHSKATP
jgi:hypothetical protein